MANKPRCGAETSHSYELNLDQICELPAGHAELRHKWTHPSGTFCITWLDLSRVDAAIARAEAAEAPDPAEAAQ